jgi:predicted ester cyclase
MQTIENQKNKQLVSEFWRALDGANSSDLSALASTFMSADTLWHGPDPINSLHGPDEFVSGYWQPLLDSFSNFSRETHILMGGKSSGRIDGTGDGQHWVAGTGYFNATFAKDYLGIPASEEKVSIRWGEFCRLDEGRIVESYVLLDYIDLMQQAGFEVLPPSRGIDGLYPPPVANDGVMLDEQDAAVSDNTLQHIRRFIFEGLNAYDQSELKSMGMADFFHPDVKWYGPGGIGACLSLREFEENHQKHWLHAYPDRAVQNLDALIAEGAYSGGPGWAGVLATHTGEYLDVPATGKAVEFNGLDFWKLENDMYVENWVFVDMIHLYRQFGIDLFERLPKS